jgi:hypothetical protein
MQEYNQEVYMGLEFSLPHGLQACIFIAMSHTSLHGYKDRFCIVFGVLILVF